MVRVYGLAIYPPVLTMYARLALYTMPSLAAPSFESSMATSLKVGCVGATSARYLTSGPLSKAIEKRNGPTKVAGEVVRGHL